MSATNTPQAVTEATVFAKSLFDQCGLIADDDECIRIIAAGLERFAQSRPPIAKVEVYDGVTTHPEFGAGAGAGGEVPCQNPNMPPYACKNRAQCWEPCGELGHSAEHVRISRPATEPAAPVSVVGLTQDEIHECMKAMAIDHDGSDFEPECPGCTAYKKLAAILASKAGTAAGVGG